MNPLLLLSCILILSSCRTSDTKQDLGGIRIVSAMKNVMWKGELYSKIDLDTISNEKGLYGIGPLAYLKGELLIMDGTTYVSRVVSDSTMEVRVEEKASAPFFVYTHQEQWKESVIPSDISNLSDLEEYITKLTLEVDVPFVFRMKGTIASALIHIQNLADGATVSSPKEAHAGQVKYPLGETEVDIVGFYSKHHHGVFTHHDTNFHLHLITRDRTMMGHLDEITFDKHQPPVLLLPEGLGH